MSVAALARKTGISGRTLQRWYARKPRKKTTTRGEPKISDAIKLAEAMRMTLGQVFHGEALPVDEQVEAEAQEFAAGLRRKSQDREQQREEREGRHGA